MTTSADVFLGIIAIATLVTAIVQVALIVAATLLARRVARLAQQVERELKPVFAHLDAIGRDASRVTALAAAQVERADRVMADLAERIEQTVAVVQQGIIGPAREGRALFAAFRAAFDVVRSFRADSRRSRSEDEDALFI